MLRCKDIEIHIIKPHYVHYNEKGNLDSNNLQEGVDKCLKENDDKEFIGMEIGDKIIGLILRKNEVN